MTTFPATTERARARGTTARRAVTAAVASLFVASAIHAVESIPKGFDKAQFRMSVDEVQALYPDAVVSRMDAADKASSGGVPDFATIKLENQSVLGFDDCGVSMQFAADQLYFVHVNCGSKAEIRQRLEETYGEPAILGGNAYWRTEDHAVSLDSRSMVFGFYDRKMDQLVQARVQSVIVDQALGNR